MEYEVKRESPVYQAGRYYVNVMNQVSQIIYDEDRGYALLDIKKGMVETDFYDEMDELVQETVIGEMKEVVLAEVPTFRIKE